MRILIPPHGVGVIVGVLVGVGVIVRVGVIVGVLVIVRVGVMVGVFVRVGVAVAPVQVNVQLRMSCVSVKSPLRAPKPTVAGDILARFSPPTVSVKESILTCILVPVVAMVTV